MRHARNEWSEAATLLRLRSCERERSHRASVKSTIKRNYTLAFCVVARQLERALDGFSSRVPKVELMWARHRRDSAQSLCQLGHRFVVEVGSGHVDQFGGLALNGADHFGMTVPGGCDCDASGEIEEFVSVDVFDNRSAAALCD